MKLSRQKIEDFFAPEGILAAEFAGYEYRPQQQEMALKITEVFNNKQHLLVEAGTGTGKSFAYLVPSMLYAADTDEQVVVSTNTINLQEQLIEKDIPQLKEILGLDCQAVLAKGRSNYLCLRKLNQYQKQGQFASEEYEELQRINQWLRESQTGCRSDLSFSVAGDLWSEICSETRSCPSYRCPFYEQCFFMLARANLQEADLLVVNHHLLFADVALRGRGNFTDDPAVLPPYERVIFDEAHNLEEIATTYLGSRISHQEIIDTVQAFYDPAEQDGLLMQLRANSSYLPEEAKKEVRQKVDSQLTGLAAGILDQARKLPSQVDDLFSGSKLRLTEPIRKQEYWSEVLAVELENLRLELKQLRKRVAELLILLTELEGEAAELETLSVLIGNRLETLKVGSEVIAEIVNEPRDNYVYWLEKWEAGYSLHSAPLDIADKLQANLLDNLKSGIFTSATLSVNNSFDFIIENLGLPVENVETLQVGSPFDYSQQLEVGVVRNLPAPDSDNFVARVTEAVGKIIQANAGRCLVLFTSYYRLNKVQAGLSARLADLNLDALLYQGQKPRQQLIEEFKTTDRAVLLGTDSFWEGVDIPGDKLNCLVIVKLPFLVPSEPVIEAKLETITEQGNNSFQEYMLPKAVIRFRQGCGRLIRTKGDQGWLFILDNRVLTKNYGRLFLSSLPGREKILIEGTNSLVNRLPGAD